MSFALNLEDRGTEFISLDPEKCPALPAGEYDSLEFFDLCYRTLCAVMFNHASSGHPGGSVSSGRIVESLLFNQMDYDMSNPMDRTADIISYAAGHKALGLYAMWACATKSCARSTRANCRTRYASKCGWKICSVSAKTRSPARRCSWNLAPNHWTATRRRKPRLSGYPPARAALASPPPSAWR